MKSSVSSRFDRLVDVLGGLKLSFILMVILGLLVAQRAVIAQKVAVVPGADIPAFLRFMNALGLASSDALAVPFAAAMGLFLVNLLFSCVLMLRKVRTRLRGMRSFREAEDIVRLACRAEFAMPAGGGERLTGALRRRGYRVASRQTSEGHLIAAAKRESGTWGVLFFHLTFLVVMLGAALSILTRFSGYAELSPGDLFTEKLGNYQRKTERPRLFGQDRNFSLRLEEIDLSFWRPGVVRQRACVVSAFGADGSFLGRERIEVNRPLSITGMSVYQGSGHGFAAGVEVSDEAGTRLPLTVRFPIPEKEGERLFQRVRLPGTGLALELELFTEQLARIEGLETLASHNAVTLMKVTTLDSLGHRQFRGVLFGGARLHFEGLTVGFLSLKPYTSLLVVRDYGIPVVFAGFALLLLGLVVTYFWVPESLWCAWKREGELDRVVLGGVAEKYHESFRERFGELVDDVRREAMG